MQPRRLAFTDTESRELGEYLDKFVAAGPLLGLGEEKFRNVQVLVARKIWEIRPDIARAMQEVADADQPPALVIENVPVDAPLPCTPDFVKPYDCHEPPVRSHYFNAGVALIRYGNVVPLSSVTLFNSISEVHELRDGYFSGRDVHRDIFNRNIGDIALHVQRENPRVATPLVGIGDIPKELLERLKKARLSYNSEKTPVIQDNGEGLRFHPRFKEPNDSYSIDDREAADAFFTWIRDKMLENPLVLHDRDFLLLDQSRAFHAATAHYALAPHAIDRWVTHMRCEVLDGIHHALQNKNPYYTLPEYIDEAAVLRDLAAAKRVGKSAALALQA